MVLKITTIPYLISAIIHGIGQLNQAQAVQILKKGLLFIGCVWLLNILMVYVGVFLFPLYEGTAKTTYMPAPSISVDFASLLIPENIFYSLSANIIPSIVVFALIVGISLMYIRDKKPLINILGALVDSFTCITHWIGRITPVGTFLIIANQAGTIRLETVKQVSSYVILYILILSTVIFWIMPRMISSLTKTSSLRWIRDLFPILLLGYTTNVVIVCLPFIIELIKKEMEQFFPVDEKTESQIQGIVSITFNLPLGSLFITLFVFFIGILYGHPLSSASQVQLFICSFLTSLGSVGLGAWINSLNFILETLGLPLESVNMYLTTLPFTSGFQAMTSVMQIASLAFLITCACHRKLSFNVGKFIKKSSFTFIPIIGAISLLKEYNPLPTIRDDSVSIFDLVQENPPLLVSRESTEKNHEDPLLRILTTKEIRVGVNPSSPPFCFWNHLNQLAGYDIAMAKRLAEDLHVKLILIPMEFSSLVSQLQKGTFDIAMSAVSITEERLPFVYFSKPYLEGAICFVAREKGHKFFAKKDALEAHPEITIAVLKGSIYECLATDVFSDHSIIPLDDISLFPKSSADLFLWTEKEAISWITHHPGYTIVTPSPSLGMDLFAYALPRGANLFLNYVNVWLSLKQVEGFTDAQYNLWVLGKTQKPSLEKPRWSVLQNILGMEEK